MKITGVRKTAFALLTALMTGSALSGAQGASAVQQLAAEDSSDVIVILRDQLAGTPATRGARAERMSAVASAQTPILAELQHAGASRIRSFGLLNAVATTVSKSEAARLAAHPLVRAVVPDAVIRLQPRRAGLNGATTSETAGSGSSVTSGTTDGGLCNTLEPEALQLTNAAFADPTVPQAQLVRDGHGQPVTGSGVKVAFLADGIDPTQSGFIRPNGTSVFIDYQDFSGDPAGTPTAGGEAFGDASSIAAQDTPHGTPLTFDISQFVNAAHALPSPCSIRIRGIAPGASLVGLKIFGANGATTSGIVQAIEYAVVHDDVDVINESFGGEPFPDNDNDPISLANAAAVQAGVTVVVSTGDAGTAGTLGSSSTDPYVIAAGASTQFRFYAQTGYGAQALAHGYLSNNISALSSGGFAQTGARTVDVVAPGDLSWALCSTNATLFTDCTNFQTPAVGTPVESFGGTSEAAPLTSGTAALVIQAYRSTHGGASPSPALVKRIIMSTASDLGAPAFEQGAGLINALAAVNVALSVQDGNGRPQSHGTGLLASPTSVAITDVPGAHESRSFTITNAGAKAQHLAPAFQTLGAPIAGATLSLTLHPASDPTFPNVTGAPRSYIRQTFQVPSHAQHLDAAVAYPNPIGTANYVYLSLLDPSGRQVAYSLPQGSGSGYGHVDVVDPAAGTWTAVLFTRPKGVAGSYAGPIEFSWSAEQFVNAGTVAPSVLDLAPGASATVTAEFTLPAEAGDSSAALRFTSLDADAASLPGIPVTMRALIPIGGSGGTFSGTLTGGNGRPGGGPTQTFAFDVPDNIDNMSLVLQVPDNGYLLEGLLVDPNGMELSVQPNIDALGNPQYALQIFRSNPQPGRWRFILLLDFTASGNQVSVPFSARIGFNTARVAAAGLPNSPNYRMSAHGKPLTVPILVTNTGAVTTAYFADARSTSLAKLPLFSLQGCAVTTLPGACGLFFLPTEVSSVQFFAAATAPISMDAFNSAGYNVGATGSPDIYARNPGHDTVVATLSEPEIPWGPWITSPALIGPYGPSGAPTTAVTNSAVAVMQGFDAAVSADSGDIWADLTFGTNTFAPLVLAPGQSGTIHVTITPDPTQVSKLVAGSIYIDTFNSTVASGDEVVRIPYRYTVVN